MFFQKYQQQHQILMVLLNVIQVLENVLMFNQMNKPEKILKLNKKRYLFKKDIYLKNN